MIKFKKDSWQNKLHMKNIIKILPPLFIFLIPIFLSRYPYTRISKGLVEETYKKYMSKEVQNDGNSISVKSFSRKDSAYLKLQLLSKIKKSQKDIIIFSNHQLQYITGELSDKSIFNMWMGDYGITEIADIVSYIDKFDNSLFPNKILITHITSPNNDYGDAIVGYRDELPDFIVGSSRNPYVNKKNKLIFSPGSLFSSSYFLRRIRHSSDFKTLWGFLKSEIFRKSPKTDVSILKTCNEGGFFSFNKTGSTISCKKKKLRLNNNHIELEGKGKIYLSNNDIDEIVFSLKQIDNIANRREIVHFVIIPPVYESSSTKYMDSFVNKVLDKSLQKFSKSSKSTFVIDHRRDKRFLDIQSAKYYVDFDHPSSLYGVELLKEINKTLNINF